MSLKGRDCVLELFDAQNNMIRRFYVKEKDGSDWLLKPDGGIMGFVNCYNGVAYETIYFGPAIAYFKVNGGPG